MLRAATFAIALFSLIALFNPSTGLRAQDLDCPTSGAGDFDPSLYPEGYADSAVRRRAVYIVRHDVDVEIRDRTAQTVVTEVFRNPTSLTREATFRFYLPEGTAVDGFEMTVNGTRVQGDLLDADQARNIYEGIVRRDMDPGLLQFVGRQMYQARVYPVVPNGDTTIRIRYTQALTSDAGMVRYRYPLNTSKYSPIEVEQMTVSMHIATTSPLRLVYSPSHTVIVERSGMHEAVAVFNGKNVVSDRDFMMFFASGGDAVDLSTLNWRENSQTDGYFMLSLSPQLKLVAGQEQPKDLMLVLDTSGSMGGSEGKMEAARNAVLYTLDRLNPGDRFGIIAYSTNVNAFDGGALQLATPETIKRAIEFVKMLAADGGTNIEYALRAALTALSDGSTTVGGNTSRPSMVVFLTDGQPTVASKNVDELVAIALGANDQRARIFTFGVGTDVNTHLLDRIAEGTGGARCYVGPGEELETTVSAFYNKVAHPALTDLRLRAIGGQVMDIYPRQLPDLFVGSNVVLFGRWRGGSAPRIELTGTCGDRSLRFVTAAPDPEVGDMADESGNAFISRLWAIRKVGYLLDQERLNGKNEELQQSIARLGTRYGIATPYNSFLVTEPDMTDPRQRNLRTPDAVGATGEDAVRRAKQLDAMRRADSLDQVVGGSEVARQDINGKTFVRKGEWWLDTTFDPAAFPEADRVVVQSMSTAYFDLIRAQPVLARYASVGAPAVIVFNGTAYVIEPAPTADQSGLSADDLANAWGPHNEIELADFEWQPMESAAAADGIREFTRAVIGR